MKGSISFAFILIIGLILYSLGIGTIENYCSVMTDDSFYQSLNQSVEINYNDTTFPTSTSNPSLTLWSFIASLTPFSNSCDYSIWLKLPMYAMFLLLMWYIIPFPFKSA